MSVEPLSLRKPSLIFAHPPKDSLVSQSCPFDDPIYAFRLLDFYQLWAAIPTPIPNFNLSKESSSSGNIQCIMIQPEVYSRQKFPIQYLHSFPYNLCMLRELTADRR